MDRDSEQISHSMPNKAVEFCAKSNDGTSLQVTQDLLQSYYSHLFPYSFIYAWLSYGNSISTFSRREFSFTIEPTPGEEIYLRYQSFSSQEELRQIVMKRIPKKIDIGAIYSQPPKDKIIVQSGKLTADARELVFDVDMDDYDSVRKCGCSGASICPICWGFMKMAVKVMDKGLREDFGFHHIAWFYSGRRGVHAWVCDEVALGLTDEARGAITKYFQVDIGCDNNRDDFTLKNPIHPMLRRSFDILEPMFIEYVIPASGHGLLASKESWESVLNSLPKGAEAIQSQLSSSWSKVQSTPEDKWKELKKHISIFVKETSKAGNAKKAQKSMSDKERNRLELFQYELVFRHTYPRLDVNVSKARNHLLKSPFCVHPKSGRVCVPIRAKNVDSFDPFKVPSLNQVLKELDDYEKENKVDPVNAADKRKSCNWQKTSLKDYYEPFEKEFLEPLIKQNRRSQRDHNDQQAAVKCDF